LGGFGEPKETVMFTTDTDTRSAIARQNDHFRRHPGSDWIITASVQAKGPVFVLSAASAVSGFDAFTGDNDPHGEHDFGTFELCGERLFWKIDYYDRDLRFGSPDPTDHAVTRRVLTIMLASDY
jgi:hypothetical protein